MSWNHKSRIVAMAIALQPVAGTFTAPSAANTIPVSAPNNNFELITATDPTATGAIWQAPDVDVGQRGTAGANFPLRGPGGSAPPAANGWPQGLIMQAAGWEELINATPRTANFQTGSTTTALVLATAESTVDDFLIGAPIQTAAIGTSFRQTSLVQDYTGASRTAALAETLGAAPASGVAYTVPAYVLYRLGTLIGTPPLLSISIWRDKKRYDYKDWRPSSLVIDIPVFNDANTTFPSGEFTGTGTPAGEVDEAVPAAALTILEAAIANTPPPAQGGKFYVDRTMLGHQSLRFTESLDLAAASNQNQDAGQDAQEIMSGTRQVDLDLNQMNVSDFNIKARVDAKTILPILSTWGRGPGNNFGFILPQVRLGGMSPGDRNGFVNLTGQARVTAIDKSAALAIWW